MYWIIIILSLVSTALIYAVRNLLKKYETLEAEFEELNEAYEQSETKLSDMAGHIDNALSRMKDLDKIGSFEADDETGYVFKELYEIVEELEKYYNGEESEE
jgi:predicted  nucleic acid-binding Zn-ribbon protein